jgi:hypothetical protein
MEFSMACYLGISCNVDCAFFNNNTIMGYGICFRDGTTAEAQATTLHASIKASFSQGYQNEFEDIFF